LIKRIETRTPRSGKRTVAVSVAVVLLLFLAAVRAEALSAPYTLGSKYILFDIDKKIIYCEGQSEFLYKTMRVQADTIRVDVKFHVLYAEGNVVVSTMGSTSKAAPAAQQETIAEEDAERIERETTSRETASGSDYQGEQFRFDIERIAGELIQTRKNYRHIYLQGEALNEVSQLPVMNEGEFLYDEPEVTTNAVTASRFRVSPGDQYEAWHARMWVKGNKVLNVPYYTNSSKKITPGNWRLKSVSYSSNTNWNIGASVRYSEKRTRQGFVDLVYKKSGDTRYALGLNQAFQLGKLTAGSFSLSNALTGDSGYMLSLNRHGGSMRSQSLQIGYDRENPVNVRLTGNTKWDKKRVRGFVYATRSRTQSDPRINAIFDVDQDTKYLGKSRTVGYQINTHATYESGGYEDAVSDGNVFVAVSAFHTGINLSKRSRVSMSSSSGLGAGTEGDVRGNMSGALRYSLTTRGGRLYSLSYSARNSRSYGRGYADQGLSASVSVSRSSKSTFSLYSSYDLRKSTFGSVSTNIDYIFSKKCRLWSDMTYDLVENHLASKNFNMSYNMYGTLVNTRWFVESNDFMFDFSTNFR